MQRLPSVPATSGEEIVRGFIPTRRFVGVSFDSYVPDPRFPSQQAARAGLRALTETTNRPRRGLFGRARPRAVYLDGGYGVGKTHLLAATYHAVSQPRLYLSFAELAYTISRLGMAATLAAFADSRLLCIDEFELDDVAQTRMAATFLRQVLTRTSVVVTSNTLPSDLGQGRFAAEAFQQEIGEIGQAFEVLSVDGEDYRQRQWHDLGVSETVDSAALRAAYERDALLAKVLLRWPELAEQLAGVHPVHYGQIAGRIEALYVDDLERIDNQAVALRLVHFVDKLYDQQVRVTLSTRGRGKLALREIFAPAYRHGGYEKKYRRCLSRLHELVAETDASRPAPAVSHVNGASVD